MSVVKYYCCTEFDYLTFVITVQYVIGDISAVTLRQLTALGRSNLSILLSMINRYLVASIQRHTNKALVPIITVLHFVFTVLTFVITLFVTVGQCDNV